MLVYETWIEQKIVEFNLTYIITIFYLQKTCPKIPSNFSEIILPIGLAALEILTETYTHIHIQIIKSIQQIN